jgi:hypothetical protein
MKDSVKYSYLGAAIALASAILIAKNQKLETIGYLGLGIVLPIIGAAIGNQIGKKTEKSEGSQLAGLGKPQFQSLDIKNLQKA